MFLLDTNALIILLYGEVADGRLSEESKNKIRGRCDLLVIQILSVLYSTLERL